MAYEERVHGQGDAGDGENPQGELTPLDALVQAHPDIAVGRTITGKIGIVQHLQHSQQRQIDIELETEKKPVIVIKATYIDRYSYDETYHALWKYGLVTIMRVHPEQNGQVRAVPEYRLGTETPPKDLFPNNNYRIRALSLPIPPLELVTVARTGLEMLEAFA